MEEEDAEEEWLESVHKLLEASEVSNGEVESISRKSPFLPLYPTVGCQEKL